MEDGYKILKNESDGVWLLFARRPFESDDIDGWDEIDSGFDTAVEALQAALELAECPED